MITCSRCDIYVVVGSGGQSQGNVQTIQSIIKASAAYNTVFASEYNLFCAFLFWEWPLSCFKRKISYIATFDAIRCVSSSWTVLIDTRY